MRQLLLSKEEEAYNELLLDKGRNNRMTKKLKISYLQTIK